MPAGQARNHSIAARLGGHCFFVTTTDALAKTRHSVNTRRVSQQHCVASFARYFRF
jgi:hypothetical protein